jgi:hypothetical protein
MSLNTTFSTINSLGDYPLIAGGTYTMKFTVLDQSGSPVSLSTVTCSMKLAPFGTDYTVLTKTGSVIATNIFSITLSAEDTSGLSGKYTYQPILTLATTEVLKPAQGILTIVRGLQ